MRKVRQSPSTPIRADDENDLRIASFLDEMGLSPPTTQEAFVMRLIRNADPPLTLFAERMATLAVRTGDYQALERAVQALALAFWASADWRDALVVYPLPYDAARRIGADPDSLFLEIAEVSPEPGAQSLRDFIRRSEHDKSLAVMGYEVGADVDGFRYVRTW